MGKGKKARGEEALGAQSGLADCQVPVDQVADEITRRVAVGR